MILNDIALKDVLEFSRTPEHAAALMVYHAAGYKCVNRYGNYFIVQDVRRDNILTSIAVSEMFVTARDAWHNMIVPEYFDDMVMWLRSLLDDKSMLNTLPVSRAQSVWQNDISKSAHVEMKSDGWSVSFLGQTLRIQENNARYPLTIALTLTFLLACGYQRALEEMNFVTANEQLQCFDYGRPLIARQDAT